MANSPIKITHVSSSSEVIYQLLAENHQFLCGANFIKMFFLLTIFWEVFRKIAKSMKMKIPKASLFWISEERTILAKSFFFPPKKPTNSHLLLLRGGYFFPCWELPEPTSQEPFFPVVKPTTKFYDPLMKQSILPILLVAVTCLTLGFGAGRITSPKPKSTAANSPKSNTPASSSSKSTTSTTTSPFAQFSLADLEAN